MAASRRRLTDLALIWVAAIGTAHAQTASPGPAIHMPFPAGVPAVNLRAAGTVFGNHYVVKPFAHGEPHPHRDARGIVSISKEALGSGVDGVDSSASADFVAMLEAKKTSWPTSLEAGEIDGLLLVTRQGRYGDAASLLFNGQKVRSGADDTGGMTGVEGELRWVTERGEPTLGMHLTVGILEGRGGSSAGTGNGYVAEASLGQPFAAFYGGAMPSSPGTRWQYLLWGSLSRDNSDVYASIDTNGNQYLRGALRVNGAQININSFTPASSNSPCEFGQHAWDERYEYRCVARNRWKRAVLESW